MAGLFEVIDLNKADQELRIEVIPGTGNFEDGSPDTAVYIKPPLSVDEHQTLLQSQAPDSGIIDILAGSLERKDRWLRGTLNGAPSEAHVALGIRLAEEVMVIRGIQAAHVVSEVDHIVRSQLVQHRP